MSNADQEAFWQAQAGHDWVALQVQMDRLLQPVLDLVLDHAALRPGQRVLDVGCGTGASVVQAARAVGPEGHVTGVDIAETMLDLARRRLGDHPGATCLRADAQTHRFAPASHDAMISRFGVMFFDDTTAAFANIARALTPGARLTCAAWGPAPHNPYFIEAAAAARDVFGPMDKVDRTLPGPFAFEDAARVIPMLAAAGLRRVTCDPCAVVLIAPADIEACAEMLCQIGPAHAALRTFDASAAERARLRDALVARFARFRTGTGIEIPAAINLFTARRGAKSA